MQGLFKGLLFAGGLAAIGCSNGTVAPGAALVTGQIGVTGIAVDDFYMYWTIGDSVKRVSLDGGEPVTLVSGQRAPTSVTLDTANIYWTTGDGTVTTAPKSGGTGISLAQEPGMIRGFGIDDTSVYWTTDSDEGAVRKVPKAGGTTVTLASNRTNPGGLALVPATVYWSDETSGGSLVQMPTDGSAAPTAVASVAEGTTYGVGSDTANVYWTDNVVPTACTPTVTTTSPSTAVTSTTPAPNGSVNAAALDGSAVRVLASALVFPTVVLGDAVNAYWTASDGSVNLVPVDGSGAVVQLGQGAPGAVSLALDAVNVYWANSNDGSLMAMPKP
jgi:hypothetical protein